MDELSAFVFSLPPSSRPNGYTQVNAIKQPTSICVHARRFPPTTAKVELTLKAKGGKVTYANPAKAAIITRARTSSNTA